MSLEGLGETQVSSYSAGGACVSSLGRRQIVHAQNMKTPTVRQRLVLVWSDWLTLSSQLSCHSTIGYLRPACTSIALSPSPGKPAHCGLPPQTPQSWQATPGQLQHRKCHWLHAQPAFNIQCWLHTQAAAAQGEAEHWRRQAEAAEAAPSRPSRPSLGRAPSMASSRRGVPHAAQQLDGKL